LGKERSDWIICVISRYNHQSMGGTDKFMAEEYTIVYVNHPEQSAWGIIGRGINDYNRDTILPNSFK
jgi:hypothetical protein